MTFYPVVLCGGSGARLWPSSRASRPKQFIPLVGRLSSFQQTARRARKIPGSETLLVVAGVDHAAQVEAQLAAVGIAADVLYEPAPRDSAPAIAVAASWVARRDANGIMVVVASDHYIPDDQAFVDAVTETEGAARAGLIVTLGIAASAPSSAYGYIEAGEALHPASAVRRVARFIEKPDTAKAGEYFDAGYLWNSGNFVVGAATALAQFERYAPAVAAAASQAVVGARRSGGGWRLGDKFLAAPKISFDYAIMEKTDCAATMPVTFSWSDLGAWDAIWRASPKDERGNVGDVAALFVDTRDSLVRAPRGKRVALIGVKNLAVVDDGDALLVCDLSRSQAVRDVESHYAGLPEPHGDGINLADLTSKLDLWLRTSALPLWWAVGADHHGGGFFDTIDQDGRAVAGPRRARVQARQTHVFAQAALRGFDGPWAAAAEHGYHYLGRRLLRPDGLYRSLVGEKGEILDDTPHLYDQAFILMARASLFALSPGRGEMRDGALRHLGAIRVAMSHAGGGFQEAGPHAYQANAHMHLLEAALAWIEVDDAAEWRAVASLIVELALGRFIDDDRGLLREFFDANWAPAPGEDGGLVEPGHQFEWSWLLQRWALRTGDATAARASLRLFESGRRGIDARRRVVIDELTQDHSVRSARARLWPQTEYAKAAALLLSHCAVKDRDYYSGCALEAANALWLYLQTAVPGLWRDKLMESGSFLDEPAPASSLYHIDGAIEALRGLTPL